MQLNKNRKWIKRILIPLFILLILGSITNYIIVYRFKDILKIAVEKETNGVYGFNAADIDVSLCKKKISIRNAVLTCNDTAKVASHYALDIPDVFLSIHSWQDLILHGKLIVDSLNINTPDFKTHVHSEKEEGANKKISFHVAQVFGILQKLVNRLEIRSFHLNNGSFTFSNKKSNSPFISNRLTISIENFSKKDYSSAHLFSADDIDFLTTNQQWKLPDGKHEISFRKLHFSGKNQSFELDSCTLKTINQDSDNITLTADKLFFNSKQLASVYEKEELYIDTLILKHPVLDLQKKNTVARKSDSSVAVTQALHELFKGVNFKYIDIEDGQFLLYDKTNSKASSVTDKTNLKIYNLTMSADAAQSITTDSIQAKLKNIRFLTKDSLFELGINDFTIHNNDLFLQDVAFNPTVRNHIKNLDFKAPRLRLEGISLEDLLNKKLRAQKAELYNPLIRMTGKRKDKSREDRISVTTVSEQGKLDNFYKSIHGLSELLAVDTFRIVNGNMEYKAPGTAPVQISLKKINANILLQQFLKSDSILDIKHSIPDFKIGIVNVRSPKIKLNISNYEFNGLVRHNFADNFSLVLSDNSEIKGKQVAWQALDWDSLIYSKRIQVDGLQVHQLSLNMQKREKKDDNPAKKELPQLLIRRLDIDDISYNINDGGKQPFHFNGSQICVDKINSRKNFLEWDIALGILTNIHFDNGKTQVAIEKLNLDNKHETIIEKANVNIAKDNGDYTKLNIPILKLAAGIKSTDLSQLQVNSLVTENIGIDLYKKSLAEESTGKQKKKLKLPLDLAIKNIIVRNASLHYRKESGKDTMSFSAGININTHDIVLHKSGEKFLQYDKTAIDILNLRFNKHQEDISITKSSIVLTNGHLSKNNQEKIALKSGVLFNWNNAAVNMVKPGKHEIALKKLTGVFENDNFSFTAGTKLKWQSFVNHTSLHEGNVDFHNNNITVKAGSLTWSPSGQSLSLRSFSMIPKYNIGDTLADGRIQPAYLGVTGDAIHVKGIAFKQPHDDSTLFIKKFLLEGIVLNTGKDRRIVETKLKEKPMFSSLINSVKFPFHIDSLVLQKGTITVTEISDKTNKKGTIPLEEVNAIITNIKNRNNERDSLNIIASTRLFNNSIHNFHYREAYGDSLAAFSLQFSTSPMLLTEFSQVTAPLASIRVLRGNSDTLFASWTGNKYAAIGRMNFHYRDLKVQLLDKNNPGKKKFMLTLENFLANSILLNKKNTKYSLVYFERNNQKSVFNYWVKTSMSGLMTSTGLKHNKKYYKQYLKMREQYSLPAVTE